MPRTQSRRAFLKYAVILAGAGSVVGWAASCTPKVAPTEAPKAEEKPVAKQEQATSAPAPKGAIELRFMDRGDAIGEASRHFSRVFEERNPGVTIKNESTSWADLTTKVSTAVAAGTMADVAFQHGALMIPELGAKGVWLNIEPLGDKDNIDWSIYYKWALDSLRLGPKGELVAGPESVHFGQNVLGWNKEMLEGFGFGTPSDDMTLPDFVTLLTKIQGKMPEGGFATHMGASLWDMEALARTFGSYIISPDRKTCGLLEKKTQDALKWYYDLINTHKVIPGRDQILKDQKSMFYSGMLASVFNSPNNMWTGFEAGTEGRFHLASCQMPHGGGLKQGTTPSCNAYVIYGKSKLQDTAWQLIKLLTSKEAAKWMALNPPRIGPGAIIEAWNDPEVWALNPIYEQTAKAWAKLKPEDWGALPVPLNTRRAEFHDYFNNEFGAMLYGDKPYDQAGMDKLAKDLQAIMDKPLP